MYIFFQHFGMHPLNTLLCYMKIRRSQCISSIRFFSHIFYRKDTVVWHIQNNILSLIQNKKNSFKKNHYLYRRKK
jgi:hypothetical protein